MVRRVGLWAIAAVLIVVVGLFGLRFYLDQQWYVGVANGRVAIFRESRRRSSGSACTTSSC